MSGPDKHEISGRRQRQLTMVVCGNAKWRSTVYARSICLYGRLGRDLDSPARPVRRHRTGRAASPVLSMDWLDNEPIPHLQPNLYKYVMATQLLSICRDTSSILQNLVIKKEPLFFIHTAAPSRGHSAGCSTRVWLCYHLFRGNFERTYYSR